VRQGPALDWDAVVERLTPLVDLKEAPEIEGTIERSLEPILSSLRMGAEGAGENQRHPDQ
jgi:hypothetical protein